MRKHRASKGSEADNARLECSQHELLLRLAGAAERNEKVQRKFRNAVLIRLSNIEAMLTEILGVQLADFWPPERITDEKRAMCVKEVEERVSRASKQLGLQMIRYIYEEAEMPETRQETFAGRMAQVALARTA